MKALVVAWKEIYVHFNIGLYRAFQEDAIRHVEKFSSPGWTLDGAVLAPFNTPPFLTRAAPRIKDSLPPFS